MVVILMSFLLYVTYFFLLYFQYTCFGLYMQCFNYDILWGFLFQCCLFGVLDAYCIYICVSVLL